jgi:hypothetical protein
MKNIVIFVALFCGSTAVGHDLTPDQLSSLFYEAGLKEFKQNGSAFLALEKESQESIKKLRLDRSLTSEQRKERFEALSALVDEARKTKKHFKTWTPPRINLVNGANKGDIGALHYHSHPADVEIIQILDASSAIAKAAGQWYKLENYPTGSIGDGDRLATKGVYYCSGNYSYTTVAGGSKTVLVLERLSSDVTATLMEYAATQQK